MSKISTEELQANVGMIAKSELSNTWSFQQEFSITKIKPDFSRVGDALTTPLSAKPNDVDKKDFYVGEGLRRVSLNIELPLMSFLSMIAIKKYVDIAREEAELREKIPALKDLYEAYDTMKELVGDVDPDEV